MIISGPKVARNQQRISVWKVKIASWKADAECHEGWFYYFTFLDFYLVRSVQDTVQEERLLVWVVLDDDVISNSADFLRRCFVPNVLEIFKHF